MSQSGGTHTCFFVITQKKKKKIPQCLSYRVCGQLTLTSVNTIFHLDLGLSSQHYPREHTEFRVARLSPGEEAK